MNGGARGSERFLCGGVYGRGVWSECCAGHGVQGVSGRLVALSGAVVWDEVPGQKVLDILKSARYNLTAIRALSQEQSP